MNYFKRVGVIFILFAVSGSKNYAQTYYAGNTVNSTSSALGVGNTSTGAISFATGVNNKATGHYSIAIGIGSEASGNYSISRGYYSRAQGSWSASLGVYADANGYVSYAIGNRSKATGSYAYSIGDYAQATGTNSYSIGKASIVSGSGSYAFGYYSGGAGNNAFSIGNYATANSNNSFAIGEYVSTNTLNSYVLGRGISSSTKLNNFISNSLMIGFNSNVPTLFVGPSSGMGTHGKVGIGNITTPLTALDVNGKITMRDGAFPNYIPVSDVNGTMTWADPSSLGLGSHWQVNSSDIYFNAGRVGIGTTTPNYTLDVEGNISLNNHSVFLRAGTDENHGLSYANSLSSALNVDGPFLYGWGGGALGINHAGTYTKVLTWNEYGKVGIGTSTPTARLDIDGNLKVRTDFTQGEKAIAVVDNVSGLDVCRVMSDGHIYATELTIKLKEEFPDYVFAKNYELMPLNALGNYIAENQHLPNIPKAKEVAEKGLSVGEMQVKQMEKIEELTLYILELNDYILELNKRVEQLEAENNRLKK